MVEPSPRPALEVIQAEFLLQLLVALLTTPARFDRRNDRPRRRGHGLVGEIEPLLARRTPLPYEPNLFTRQMLSEGEFGSIRHPDA